MQRRSPKGPPSRAPSECAPIMPLRDGAIYAPYELWRGTLSVFHFGVIRLVLTVVGDFRFILHLDVVEAARFARFVPHNQTPALQQKTTAIQLHHRRGQAALAGAAGAHSGMSDQTSSVARADLYNHAQRPSPLAQLFMDHLHKVAEPR